MTPRSFGWPPPVREKHRVFHEDSVPWLHFLSRFALVPFVLLLVLLVLLLVLLRCD